MVNVNKVAALYLLTLLRVWFVPICQSSTKEPLFSSTLAQGKPYRSAALKLHQHKTQWYRTAWVEKAAFEISRQFWQSKQEKVKGSYSLSALQGAG